MAASFLIVIILEFLMVLFLILGYLIRYRGRFELIAGYREGEVMDPKELSRVVGSSLLLLGILAGGTLGLVLIFPEKEVAFFLLYAAIIVPVVSVISLFGSRRYLKK